MDAEIFARWRTSFQVKSFSSSQVVGETAPRFGARVHLLSPTTKSPSSFTILKYTSVVLRLFVRSFGLAPRAEMGLPSMLNSLVVVFAALPPAGDRVFVARLRWVSCRSATSSRWP